jgi:hypothetical protein
MALLTRQGCGTVIFKANTELNIDPFAELGGYSASTWFFTHPAIHMSNVYRIVCGMHHIDTLHAQLETEDKGTKETGMRGYAYRAPAF